jgi:hypothetical protein
MNYKMLCVLGFVASATTLDAQAGGGRGAVDRPNAQRNEGPRRQPDAQLQARLDSVVRSRLSLTDEQFIRVRDVATRIERERAEIRGEDGQLRTQLRQELMAATPNEERVAELLDKMPRIERRRLELLEREQRELAKFLSPVQRARYFALQDHLRREMQEMQRRRMGLDGSPEDNRRGGPPGAKRVPPPR